MTLNNFFFYQDFGYVQIAKTEKLQPYIQSCPEIVKQTREATSDIASRVVSKIQSCYSFGIGMICTCTNVYGFVRLKISCVVPVTL